MDEKVKIVDPKQAMLYMKHGLKCNCYCDKSTERIIYEFNKEETNPLYSLWLKRELK